MDGPVGVTYLDHAATTPMRRAALEAMLPFLTDQFANASGAHRPARRARLAVDEARDTVAAAIGCQPGEVVFTSGGTESDNTVIRGVVERTGGRAVCPAAEHHAVLAPVEAVGGTVVPVVRDGTVDLAALCELLGPDVGVVSVMAVNNEVGTITDLAAVAEVVRAASPGAVLHTDAVQAACWLDLRSVWTHVDALSLSGHKFGGPKGTGVLAVRRGAPMAPLLVGGGQERGMRSGTLDVAGIVGLAEALRITDAERDGEVGRIAVLRDRLVDGVVRGLAGVPGIEITETVSRRSTVAGAAHLCLGGVESEVLLFLLDDGGVCASAASACSSGAAEPSHVLAAMGVAPELAAGSLRLTLGHSTTGVDVDRAVSVVVDAICRIAERSSR